MINSTKYFDLLFELYDAKEKSLVFRIKELKRLLQHITTDYTSEGSMQFPSLFARLDFLYRRESIPGSLKGQINAFRFRSKTHQLILEITEGQYYGYLLTIGKLVSTLSKNDLPVWIVEVESIAEYVDFITPKIQERYTHITGHVFDITTTHILLNVEDGNRFRIPLTSTEITSEYQDTLQFLKVEDRVSLLDVKIVENGDCLPVHVVYQPDYLVDISSIAECFHNIGGNEIASWQLYFVKRFISIETSQALLKGNVANFFMDEVLNTPSSDQPLFSDLVVKSFANNPFEYTVLFNDDADLKEFINNLKVQFENIKRVVQLDLSSEMVDISIDNAILEPAFICEKIGLKGRLDILDLSQNNATIIELKSGRLPWPYDDPTKVSDNHAAQARMYGMVLKYVYGLRDNEIKTSICYSSATARGQNIRWVPKYLDFEKRILNTRNIIINLDRVICSATTASQIEVFFRSLSFEKLGIELHPNLNWFKRDWDLVQDTIGRLDDVERKYFFWFYQFVCQEMLLSKIGDGSISKGLSALWNKEELSDNDESNSIEQLEVIENHSDDDNPHLVLCIANFDKNDSYNFRKGDICVLYQKKTASHIATSGQIFKCTISKEVNVDGQIEVVFRYKQSSQAKDKIFNNLQTWSLEHDNVDYAYNSMVNGLFKFIQTEGPKRKIILGRSQPEKNEVSSKIFVLESENKNQHSRDEQNRLLNKALAADSFFLLIGPPGTGKTSIMLKHLVKELHKNQDANILVLAYTNRAVDEICDAVNNAYLETGPEEDVRDTSYISKRKFIRIGTRLGTSEEHQHNLLSVVSDQCTTRADLNQAIREQRVFVSTVSSITSKTDLFKLKQFDTVIIDEASQILEPHLVGLLCQFEKFILIGDQKQLPAVSLQDSNLAKRAIHDLNSLEIQDLRESYFERLLRVARKNDWNSNWGMLTFQGRMHEQIATFPNHCFYGSELKVSGLPHQIGGFAFKHFLNPIQEYLGTKRLLYIPSKRTELNNNKVNEFEAKAVAKLVKETLELYGHNKLSSEKQPTISTGFDFETNTTIGVITPYRSQISQIKKELERIGITNWESITVDTVERYQGSQKDIIILSLCVNTLSQLELLTANVSTDYETGQLVDRKLNVALTRARKQLIVLGNPYIISNNPVYYKLVQFIKSNGGWIKEGVKGIIDNKVEFRDINDTVNSFANENIQTPNDKFKKTFEELIISPIKLRSNEYPKNILGNDIDYNRSIVVGYGRAKFDEHLLTHTSDDRTLLYCYYNMRKHYFTQLAIFKTFDELFENRIANNSHKLAFFDWGCGPCTAGMALQTYLEDSNNLSLVRYVGIDISIAMQKRARTFLDSPIFGPNFTGKLIQHISELNKEELEDALDNKVQYCIFNFSYFFGNVTSQEAEKIAVFINSVVESYPLNKYSILFQNSALVKRNHSYNAFKRTLKNYKESLSRVEDVSYSNQIDKQNLNSENVFYELLQL